MNWRPWVIASLGLGTMVTLGAELALEEIEPPEAAAELKNEEQALITKLRYGPSERRRELTILFGADNQDLVDDVTKRIERLVKSHKAHYVTMLTRHRDEVATALCTGGELPPPYAALSFLAQQDGTRRVVPKGDQITSLHVQEWFSASRTADVYTALETTRERPEDATLVAIAGLLAGQDEAILGGEDPFDRHAVLGRKWGWARVKSKWPEVERSVVEYFALMYLMTELANDPEAGICI